MRPLATALIVLTLIAAPALATKADGGAGGSPEDFRVTLRVEAPGGKVDYVALGVSPTATAGYDSGLDKPEPPSPPGDHVQAYVIDDAATNPNYQRLNVSIMPGGANTTWTVRVDVRSPGGVLKVSWDPAEASVADADRRLELVTGETARDLKLHDHFEAPVDSGRQHFELTLRWATKPPATTTQPTPPTPTGEGPNGGTTTGTGQAGANSTTSSATNTTGSTTSDPTRDSGSSNATADAGASNDTSTNSTQGGTGGATNTTSKPPTGARNDPGDVDLAATNRSDATAKPTPKGKIPGFEFTALVAGLTLALTLLRRRG